MKAMRSLGVCLALLAPAMALAQPVPASGAGDFRRMWTGWRAANDASLTVERNSVERVRQDVATADAERLHQLRSQGRALGERVGEIVRLGDCADGERVARAAGDFALVEAVRDHCRAMAPGR